MVVVLLTAEVALSCLRTWALSLLLPALCALLTSLFFERIFPKYLSEAEQKKLKDTSETPVEEETRDKG